MCRVAFPDSQKMKTNQLRNNQYMLSQEEWTVIEYEASYRPKSVQLKLDEMMSNFGLRDSLALDRTK